jgi:hypothetical protein
MSVLLFVLGAIVTMLGIGMAGYGIPINEFSFGNTLIVAGTTATVGGLIIIGIGAAVSKLQRILDALATARTPVRVSRPLEMAESSAGSRAAPMPGQIPFPQRAESATGAHESQMPVEAPASADMLVEDRAAAPAAPTLRNPEMPAVAVTEYEIEEYEDVSLSPRQPMPASAPVEPGGAAPPPPLSAGAAPVAEKRSEPGFDAPWHFSPPQPQERPPQTSYFDALWPAESKPAKRPTVDQPSPEPLPTTAKASEAANSHPASEPPVAILKSGVVDGMGYTLYVDGSIEAELPQGTLRFASINELRNYLAKSP